MREFQQFNESTNDDRTRRIVEKLKPYLAGSNATNLPFCPLMELELHDFLHFLRAFGGNISGKGELANMINIGQTGSLITKLLDEKQYMQMMNLVGGVRGLFQEFFGDSNVAVPASSKKWMYNMLVQMLRCQTRKDWTHAKPGYVYRGKSMTLKQLFKGGAKAWKPEGNSWILKEPYTSQYPMQSWSTSRAKAETFAGIRTDDLQNTIAKLQSGKQSKALKSTAKILGLSGGYDVAIPVVMRCPVKDSEFLFTAEASDKIKSAIKLFGKPLKEYEVIRISNQPTVVEYMLKDELFQDILKTYYLPNES